MEQVKKLQKEEKKARRQSWGVEATKGLGGASGTALLRQKSKDDLDLHLEIVKSQAKEAQEKSSSSVPNSPHQKKKSVFNLFGSRDKELKKEKKDKKSKKKDKALDANESSSSVFSNSSDASDKLVSSSDTNGSQNSDSTASSSGYSPSLNSSTNSDQPENISIPLQTVKSEKPKLKSFLSSRNIHSSKTERKNQQTLDSSPSTNSNVNSNASTSTVPLDKQPKRTLTIASSLRHATSIQRRGSVVFEKLGLALSATERKLKKDVISKLKYINETDPAYLESLKSLSGTSTSKQFDEDDYKQLAKHLIDLEHLTAFFDAEEVADYNKTHGDGINLSSREFFKKVHIQTCKRQERSTGKMEPKPLTLTPSPSVELTDADQILWDSIEDKVKGYFWNVWPLKIFLTTGCCSRNRIAEEETDNYSKPFAALQIGNRVLEWNRSSLCIPFEADYYFSTCLAAVELNILEDVGALVKEEIAKICPIIVDWNANKTFNSLNCNSQDFVDIVLTSLGFEPMFRNKLGTAMKELQSSLNPLEHQFKLTVQINLDTVKIDTSILTKKQTLVRTNSTQVTQDSLQAANIKMTVAQAVLQGTGSANRVVSKTIAFKSHKDVDLGYHDMKEMDILSREDFCFLLLIDRIYWMWWNVTSQDMSNYKPSLEKRELKARSTNKNCAFGWPWKEGSVQEKSRVLAYSRTTSLENPGQVQ